MRKCINRIIVAGIMCLWFTWHLVIIAVRSSYAKRQKGYVWVCGFYMHGSILVDIILWLGLILLFILLVIIE